MDFTFNNEQIKNYFDGDDSYKPIGELVYLHTHPLISPNFLTQIDETIAKAGTVIAMKRMQGHIVERYADIAIRLGKSLPDITYENAEGILLILKEVYILSRTIIEKLG